MRPMGSAYMAWAKALPPARHNLARSGVEHCPASLLGLGPRDVVANLPSAYGYRPLLEVIGRRYGVAPERVVTVSGGTSLANWLACAAALEGAGPGSEVIVERPCYDPLLQVVRSHGVRVRRLERRFSEAWAIDVERFAALVNRRTRLAVVSNLHNPTGTRIPLEALGAMARALRRVGAYLLVDEVYLECLFGTRPESCVHAGPNVVATSSLTKAYGLDGLRAGWLLGPRELVRRAARIHDLLGVIGVAPGEQMALRALRRLGAIRRRARSLLAPGLDSVRRFLAAEPRLRAHLPAGGSILLARLPREVDVERLAGRLRERHDTLVVPGRFFEAPGSVRLSFGLRRSRLEAGLRHISRALDALEPGSDRPR